MKLKTLFGGYVRSRKARNVRAEMYMKFIMYNMISLLRRHFLQHPLKLKSANVKMINSTNKAAAKHEDQQYQ